MLKPETIILRLKELDTVTEELSRYRDVTVEEMQASLSLRWTIERGLIAACNILFDVADHLLASAFHLYPETYEDSLRLLHEKGVITTALYEKMRGLGGYRNILVHDYLGIDLNEEHRNFRKSLEVFREFAREILASPVMRQ